MPNPKSLLNLAIQEVSKHQVKFGMFDTKKQYFLITKEGLQIDLGYFLRYEDKSTLERICWHEGPIYSNKRWHFNFSNLDEELRQEFDLIDVVDFYKKYIGFYEYP